LEATPGIVRVSSLANAPTLVASDDRATSDRLLDQAAIVDPALLTTRLRAAPIERAIFLAQRESIMPCFVELDATAREADVVRRVREAARAIEARHPDAGEVLLAGPAVVETSLAAHIFDNMRRLVPFAVAFVLTALLLAFRRPLFVGVAVVHTLALQGAVLGGMAMLGFDVDLVSVLAPVILVPVGVADLVHLFARLRSGSGRLESAFAALEAPMIATTATTAVGFLGFLLSPVAAIQQFGITLSAGAVVALVLTVTLDAALLALFWRPREARRTVGRVRAGAIEQWVVGLASDARRRRFVHLAGIVVAAGLILGVSSLAEVRIEDTWIHNFDPDSTIVRDAALFESELFGTNVLALVFEADPSVAEARQRTLDAVNRFTTEHTVVLGTRGLISSTLLARGLDPEAGAVWSRWPTPSLDEMAALRQAWIDRGPVLPDVRRHVDPELRRHQVQLFVLDHPYDELAAVAERLEAEARYSVGPGVRVTVSGNLAVNLRMVRDAVLGQVRSLLVLLATVTILLAIFVRSLAGGLVLVAPMVLSILLTVFVLVHLDLPFGIAVSMFPTLVVGLSVDFALHLRAVLVARREASRGRRAREVASVVRGILWNGLLWTGGFLVLTTSSLAPNRYLGLLCALVVALSTLFTLVLMPVLARPTRRHGKARACPAHGIRHRRARRRPGEDVAGVGVRRSTSGDGMTSCPQESNRDRSVIV
ncbi:MAG: MMPL family transporter, partial [Acidobacteriota bacterium]